ncbi:hypothetical protein ACFL6Y_02885 [Elusimicrobiota bacterium]
MYWFKRLVLLSCGFIVTTFSYISLGVIALFALGRGLSMIQNIEKYTFLSDIIKGQKLVEQPVTGLLHANFPMVFSGVDAAPWIYLTVVILLWLTLEFERDRVCQMKSALAKDWDEVTQLKTQEREEKRAAAEEAAMQRARLRAAKIEAAALAKAQKKALKTAQKTEPEPPNSSKREELLEIYAQTKKTLEDSKKNLSFLAIDVVNSTGMKKGEDSALAERDFRQYKKLVEKAINDNSGLKASWTPDGVMICFATVQSAVQAAQQVIKSLDHFNAKIKSIKADFKVRAGINAGKVLFDDTVRMEEMSDRNIDIAGHMQKYAGANNIFIGRHAIEGMRTSCGFTPASQEVDGCEVYVWRPDAETAASN